ncbi:uncharacterized protein JCM10292_003716 [Rhodotorula paludigena]|uniref:uncharacterized protein n=1 Tax=Rhodotorula paludigena TaxID=86838 RepID=UPI0031720BBE
MSASSPPASPSKRFGLRQLVTGVQPTDRETHAQRWQRPLLGPRSQPEPSDGHRVASLVQGWEASLNANSRPYSAMPPGPRSPQKGARPPAIEIPVHSTTPFGSSQPASSPTETRGSSPTVPAAFFQRHHARTGSSEMPSKFAVAPRSPVGKENQPRSASPSVPRNGGAAAPRLELALHSTPSTSSGSDVSRLTDALSAFTVETMATRSSDSTHASSLVTNSAEGAVVGVAAKVSLSRAAPPVLQETSPRASAPRAPRTIETAPTPARKSRPEPPSRHTSTDPALPTHRQTSHYGRDQHPPRFAGPVPFERPHLSSRTTSSFVEALPASYPSRSPDTDQYKPPPLEATPKIPQGTSRPRARPRSSSLGAALRTRPDNVQPESFAEKEARVEREFEQLLDNMQLPDRTVRTRMLGLALPIKEDMLRAASSSPPSSLSAPRRPSHQRGRSLNNALDTSHGRPAGPDVSRTKSSGGGSGFKSFLRKTKSNGSLRAQNAKDAAASSPTVGLGAPASRPSSRARSHSRTASATNILLRSFGKSAGAAVAAQVGATGAGAGEEGEDELYWAQRLRSARVAQLDAKELGRLRARLRNEAPGWVNEFITDGGYLGMLERLQELLEMEWREEQHDDQILHELLKCFKALTMTACGKRALASHSPTPFLPLTALLFSEKRPGDLPCRQILVELVNCLFDICPPASDALPKSAWSTPEVSLELASCSPIVASPASFGSETLGSGSFGSGGVRRYTRKAKSGDDEGAADRDEVLTPERLQQARRFIVSLMQGPPNEDEEAKVDFIQAAHRPRVFKTWVKELSDTVRDYFWVFCHADNLFWSLQQIDPEAIEAPKVPSGMTGGVEYEAMAYCTAHLRLINALARTYSTSEEAFAFHDQLFMSGFERVLFTLRRASLVYYQSLHLEMSRYISLARSADFNLGPRLLACLDRRTLRPEEQLVLREAERVQQKRPVEGAPQIGDIF